MGHGTGHGAKQHNITMFPRFLEGMTGCGGTPVVADVGCVVAPESKWLPLARAFNMRPVWSYK